MLEPGDSAPEITLTDHRGEAVTVDPAAASHTVVYFYPRADTPGCTAEACSFRDEWSAFEAADVAVVGISDDPVADLEPFAAEYDLPFSLLSDPDGEVASAYDSYGEKSMFGNTFDGVFRNTYVLDDEGTVVLAYEGVSPVDHAVEILDDVRALDD
ncbi:alkyl hydroperoxide reductase/ thiol specific antioxidant/ Mal allergen [Halorubrum distributum JCM 9100]|uniref:thioredoxin-dependent peroxiredoxin n=2 Tax=Halorubrum distributum TaxID=29283 RepID=M0ESR7_9EURY|nr:peroxiredoxin [Halorubrum distributum]ELZ49942.1 alkyl hydroperoxide reductase/ thiol specific antioxidant/ Mal allergen [Halorubrum distributum JCM 9100]ELZ57005.1 alkyl hydroperoxide reductase/ thiol specific antioxidant/ Mal allergen [Halorubrum distributum JCM 10118]